MAGTVERTLWRTDGWRLGRFDCSRDDPRWRRVNDIGAAAHVVFPGTTVVIAHVGGEPLLATPNHAMVYNPHQRFVRRLHDERGDHCTFLALEPETVDEAVAALGAGRAARLPFAQVAVDPRTYLASHLLVRSLLATPRADPLEVEERVARLVLRTLSAGFAARPARVPRARAAAARRALVEDAKAALAEDLSAPLPLGDLGARLHVSPYHLARVFRRATGFTLHGFRRELRVRASLARLSDASVSLTDLAFELGFASHSHFTDAFRRSFGLPPSAVRAGSEGHGAGRAAP
jgi:AraC-like DNA-binding protein